MNSKRKLYLEEEKLFFLHSYYQSGLSKHAFCREHGICCPALLNSWIKSMIIFQKSYLCFLNKNHQRCPIAVRKPTKMKMHN